MIEHLEILVEEQSAETLLRALLPRFLGGVTFDIHAHGGKSDLLNVLPHRLRGYAAWLPQNWRIVVVVDRDDEDCAVLKKRLDETASQAGMITRVQNAKAYRLVNRLAIEELEAWYFGDWDAVRAAYPRVNATIRSKSRYRESDAIAGGTWEAFERILQAGGYMKGGLRKNEVAREIGGRMDPARNQSRSFQAFWMAITDL